MKSIIKFINLNVSHVTLDVVALILFTTACFINAVQFWLIEVYDIFHWNGRYRNVETFYAYYNSFYITFVGLYLILTCTPYFTSHSPLVFDFGFVVLASECWFTFAVIVFDIIFSSVVGRGYKSILNEWCFVLTEIAAIIIVRNDALHYIAVAVGEHLFNVNDNSNFCGSFLVKIRKDNTVLVCVPRMYAVAITNQAFVDGLVFPDVSVLTLLYRWYCMDHVDEIGMAPPWVLASLSGNGVPMPG